MAGLTRITQTTYNLHSEKLRFVCDSFGLLFSQTELIFLAKWSVENGLRNTLMACITSLLLSKYIFKLRAEVLTDGVTRKQVVLYFPL